MSIPLVIAAVLGAALGVVALAQARRRARLVVTAPRLGLLDLRAGASAGVVEADRAALERVLGPAREGRDGPPACDVLFLYCDLEADGRVQNSARSLREIVRDSTARIVVVASENHVDRYVAATRDVGYGRANLVMTLDRKGPVFAAFFGRLFRAMAEGRTMPQAWREHLPPAPDTVFACELGDVAFR
jgi:hypothetical protein